MISRPPSGVTLCTCVPVYLYTCTLLRKLCKNGKHDGGLTATEDAFPAAPSLLYLLQYVQALCKIYRQPKAVCLPNSAPCDACKSLSHYLCQGAGLWD